MLVSYTPELAQSCVEQPLTHSSHLRDRLDGYYTGSYDNSYHT